MTVRVPPPKRDATPEEREARIAALRARRRARLRWLAVRAVFLGTGLVLVLVVAAWWLLGTVGGRDVLLAQIAARLPAGSSFTWERAEGPASGPMVLHDVRLVIPRQRDPDCEPTPEASCAMGEVVFTARRAMLDPHVMPLLGWRLRLERLEVSGARLSLPASDEPFRLPEWPDVLPKIEPPLSLRVDALVVRDLVVDRAGERLVAIERATGAFDARSGDLHVERLAVDSDRGRFTLHGDYVPADDYRTDLVATAVAPGDAARLGLVARGDLRQMALAIAGDAPGPLRATLLLAGGESPRWQLDVDARDVDPSVFAPPGSDADPMPLTVALAAEGVGGRAEVEGRLVRGDLVVDLLPSRVRLEEQVLALDPVRLRMLGGEVALVGTADFNAPGDPRFAFDAVADDLRWGEEDGVPVIADARLDLAGTLERWTVKGTATLSRDGLDAQLRLAGQGDRNGVDLRTLHADMPTGTLDAHGRVAWAPTPRWDLDATLAGFDPSYFLAGWPGAVDGELRSRGRTLPAGGFETTVAIADLGGTLRGRALDGDGLVTVRGTPAGGPPTIAGRLDLAIGESRIRANGSVGTTIDVEADLAPLHLADLLPDATGTVRGDLRLRGPRAAPGIVADLVATDLQVAGLAAESATLRGRLPASGGGGAIALRTEGAAIGGIALDTLVAEARGSWTALQVEARAAGDTIGEATLSGTLARRGNGWRGTLASLQLDPARGAPWRLREPAAFAWEPGRATLSRACLAAEGSAGALCATADWPRDGMTVVGEQLPLALVVPYLPARDDGRDWLLRGELALQARVRPAGNGFAGTLQVQSAGGGLKFSERARREVFSYEDLDLEARFDASRIVATLDARLFEGDPLTARVETGWSAASPLSGTVQVETDALTWMELLSPDLVDPTGRLSADITLSGTRAAPAIGGRASLQGFAAELPALAIELSGGQLVLAAQGAGRARIDGSVRTGPAGGPATGTLHVDGTLGWGGGRDPLVLDITGEEVLVSDTRDLHAVVSPDVTVRAAAGEPIEVTGTVVIPEATIDLERLDRGISPSPDVVVLDPADPEDDGAPTAVALDLTLVLGEDVALSGFGLDGSLDGRIRVRQRPGREMRATGTLVADGSYSAYGQRLEITRGRLSWSDDPVGDPVLDVRAERDLGNVTAGVDVRGRVSAPDATVWSNPATSQSEALAYLALGRPLSTTSAGERDQLNAASAALSAGGSLIASQLAASIGLDEAGVLQSRALGGSVFGIGKYLSPRLYVSYGVSLLGTGHVLTLKYLLERGFDIEVESSSIENRALLNWRIER